MSAELALIQQVKSLQLYIPQEILFTSSGSWTALYDCRVLVSIGGGGGSGGARSSAPATASGGGAGGFSQKLIRLTAGDVLSFTVGAGGAKVNGNSNGVAGGTTTLTGPSISLTANGGAGGLQAANAGVSGVAGGTASGGMINNTGGRSGSISWAGTAYGATAGGSVGIYNTTGSSSGSITAIQGSFSFVTSSPSVKYNSPNVDGTVGSNVIGAGAGTAEPPYPITGSTPGRMGTGVSARLLNPGHSGSLGMVVTTYNMTNAHLGAGANPFCGGSAVITTDGAWTAVGYWGCLGGGGGGCVSASSTATSGAGGSGFVILEVFI